MLDIMSLDFKESYRPIPHLDYALWSCKRQLRSSRFKVVVKGHQVKEVVELLVGSQQTDLALGIQVHFLTVQVKLDDALLKIPLQLWQAGEFSAAKYSYIQPNLDEASSAELRVISVLDSSQLEALKPYPRVPFVVVLTDLARAAEADFFSSELPPDVEVFVDPRKALLHLIGSLIN
jgi:hypothetical protein